MDRLPQVIAIIGPTSSGKSRLGLDLARRYGGEIVSADSRQVYRGMDLGTAKPTAAEQAAAPHHLIDIRNPDEEYSAAEFKVDAAAAIRSIQERGNLPIIVGGTGLYLRSLLENLQIPAVGPNADLRQELEALSPPELAERLRQTDPPAAELVDLANPRRVIRALELFAAGHSIAKSTRGPAQYDALKLGLNPPPEELKDRIERNVRARFAAGVVDEVKALRKRGIDDAVLASRVIIYGPALAVVDGQLTPEAAIQRTVELEAQYAKRQRTWFKRDSEITWLTDAAQADGVIKPWLITEVAA
jgi:tRNA dimethylallyltransferase